ISTDASGRVVTINPAAGTLLAGAGPPPAAGEPLEASLARDPALSPLADALSQRADRSAAPMEIDLVGGAGVSRLRLVRVPLPEPSGGKEGSLILLDDVTSLMKSNQLAAWAEMARAIAHEIKNPLTPIQLSAEHIRRLLLDRGSQAGPEIEA